jgi:hypothetical protein
MNLPLLDNLLPSMAVTIILALGYFANERMKKQYATAKAARTEAAAETGEPAGESR